MADSKNPEYSNERLLEEMQRLRHDVQKVEAGLEAVLGLDGLKNVLEHGFNQNAEVLGSFRDAFTRAPLVLDNSDTRLLGEIAAAHPPEDRRTFDRLPAVIGLPPVPPPKNPSTFPDGSASIVQKGQPS